MIPIEYKATIDNYLSKYPDINEALVKRKVETILKDTGLVENIAIDYLNKRDTSGLTDINEVAINSIIADIYALKQLDLL